MILAVYYEQQYLQPGLMFAALKAANNLNSYLKGNCHLRTEWGDSTPNNNQSIFK